MEFHPGPKPIIVAAESHDGRKHAFREMLMDMHHRSSTDADGVQPPWRGYSALETKATCSSECGRIARAFESLRPGFDSWRGALNTNAQLIGADRCDTNTAKSDSNKITLRSPMSKRRRGSHRKRKSKRGLRKSFTGISNRRRETGRNDPCPCGSRFAIKKCCRCVRRAFDDLTATNTLRKD